MLKMIKSAWRYGTSAERMFLCLDAFLIANWSIFTSLELLTHGLERPWHIISSMVGLLTFVVSGWSSVLAVVYAGTSRVANCWGLAFSVLATTWGAIIYFGQERGFGLIVMILGILCSLLHITLVFGKRGTAP